MSKELKFANLQDFIDGKFPRTESGRYYQLKKDKVPIVNVCLASRKI